MNNRIAPFRTLAVIVLFFAGCAPLKEVTDDTNRSAEYVLEHNQTKEVAFSRLRAFIAETYVSANNVVQNEDREAGNIVIQAYKSGLDRMGAIIGDGTVAYSLRIDVRDNRVRFQYTVLHNVTNEGSLWKEGGSLFESDVEQMMAFFEEDQAQLLFAIEDDSDVF